MGTRFRLTVAVDIAPLRALRGQIAHAEAIAADMAQVHVTTIAQRLVAVRTGFLWSTIRGWSVGRMFFIVAGASYAIFVEFGTSRMSARPFMTPGLMSLQMGGGENIAVAALQQIGFRP